MIDLNSATVVASVVVFCQCSAAAERKTETLPRNPFFAMDTGLRDGAHESDEAKAKLLEELGFDGFGHTDFAGLPGLLDSLDRHKQKLFTIYTEVKIDEEPHYDPNMKRGIEELKGRDTILWLHVHSRSHPKSSPDGDAEAVAVIREISDMIEGTDLRIALYPHTGFWVETTGDAVRVAKKVDRKNVGATFNLCHWLMVEGGPDPRPLLEKAMPHLFVVTVNGADLGARDWGKLIQPLDRGTFDVKGLVGHLRRMGYKGPIGLQHYAIKGDSRENLGRSISAWKKICE